MTRKIPEGKIQTAFNLDQQKMKDLLHWAIDHGTTRTRIVEQLINDFMDKKVYEKGGNKN